MEVFLQAHNPFQALPNDIANPEGTALRHEVELYSALLSRVTTSLQQLKLAVQGLQVMSQALEHVLHSLDKNKARLMSCASHSDLYILCTGCWARSPLTMEYDLHHFPLLCFQQPASPRMLWACSQPRPHMHECTERLLVALKSP